MDSILKNIDTSGKIKALMVTRNVTQADLAALLEVASETIKNRFDADRWKISDLKKIADTYEVNLKDLI